MSADEIFKLAADLSATGPKMVGPMRKVFQEIGDRTADQWRSNAVATSGTHGKHYPKSISAELRFSTNLEVEIGPDSGKKQGSMGRGFEFGSVNQPPHLDGAKAMDTMQPLAEQWAMAAIDGVFLETTGGLQDYTTKAGTTRKATAAQIANWSRGSR